MIEFGPGSIQTGVEVGAGQCPCFRWTVQVQLVSGQWETRHFLISTDALLAFQRREDPRFQLTASELYRLGSFEALLKGSRLGLRFDGVSLGHDLDRGTTDLFQTGLDLLIQLVQTEAVRLRLRSGADFEAFKMNLTEDVSRTLLTESIDFNWQSGRWAGNVSASFGIPATSKLQPEDLTIDANASAQARILTLADLEFSLGTRVGFSRDTFRTLWGVAPHDFTAQVFMNIDWVGTHPHTPSQPVSPWRQGR